MNLEDQIRDCAARGMSRTMTREVLEISQYKLYLLASAMPDLKWPERGQSIGEREGRASANWNSEARKEAQRKAVQAQRAKCQQVEFCGITDTRAGIYETWREYAEVCYPQFMYRIRRGASLIEALFTPPMHHSERRKGRYVRAG